jgi:hypothetical protein
MRDRTRDATRVERWMYALADRAEKDPRARRVLVGLVNAMFRAVVAERRRGGRRLLDWRGPRRCAGGGGARSGCGSGCTST